MPHADGAIGVRYKLETYSLNIDHRDGSPKAKGFVDQPISASGDDQSFPKDLRDMAIAPMEITENDVVQLNRTVGRWPAGT